MSKAKLETFLGKLAEVKLIKKLNHETYVGILRKTRPPHDMPNCYYVVCNRPHRFRSSHVLNVKESYNERKI